MKQSIKNTIYKTKWNSLKISSNPGKIQNKEKQDTNQK